MFKQWLAKKQNWAHLSSKHDYRGPKIYREKETTSQIKVPYEQTQEWNRLKWYVYVLLYFNMSCQLRPRP